MAKATKATTSPATEPAVKTPVKKATKPNKPTTPRKPAKKKITIPVEIKPAEKIQAPAPVIAKPSIGSTKSPRADLKRKHENEN